MGEDDAAIRRPSSSLVVAGDELKQGAGAARFDASRVAFNLADLDPSRKDFARDGVAEALEANDYGEALVAVRVNLNRSMWAYRDIVERVGEFVDGIVVPQAGSPGDVERVDTLVGMIELDRRSDIHAAIATAQALALLDEIALASDRLDALVLDDAGLLAMVGSSSPRTSSDKAPGRQPDAQPAGRRPRGDRGVVPRPTPCVPSPSTRGRRDVREWTAGGAVARRLPVTPRVASCGVHRLFRHASTR